MYTLVDINEQKELEQASELVDLFNKLDRFTAERKPVVIIDDSAEVKAGNMIAWDYAGKTINLDGYYFHTDKLLVR